MATFERDPLKFCNVPKKLESCAYQKVEKVLRYNRLDIIPPADIHTDTYVHTPDYGKDPPYT